MDLETASEPRPWWRDAVIYQIYPRSFQDSNEDGVGDLHGILRRLDYLVTLGIDAIWISPFYPSPMADFGYDVADYTGVDPLFGTLSDFDQLIAAVHARGLKLILDFVPNHTSDQHPWFIASRCLKTDPKRDWYLWRDASADGGPPNNWLSNFGGSAWTWDPVTQQYFYHSFLAQQPDLNWRNPEVRKAVYDAMRFWLERGPGKQGVDGFRMDVLWLLIKDAQFRSNPPNPDYHNGPDFWSLAAQYTANQPETMEIVREMRALMDGYSSAGNERLLIGEIYLPIDELVAYYGADQASMTLTGAQMPFNFHLIQTAWNADAIADLIVQYEAALPQGAWPNWVLGNHDQKRLASRIGAAQSRVAAFLLLTLRGTPTLYYGDELGMPDACIAPEDVQDPAEKNQPGMGQGRDPERSPMLWDNIENAGFAAAGKKTWLPMVWDWPQFTVETQETDAHSILNLYRTLLALRGSRVALHAGAIEDVRAADGVLSYTRVADDEHIAVYMNMTDQDQNLTSLSGLVILSSNLDRRDIRIGAELHLKGNEAVVLRLA